MKLILVRHGEAESNAKKVVGGRKNFPLTEKGIEQAKRIGKRLKDEKIDMAFCSPLSRAKQTAEEILKHHPKVPVSYEKDIIEMCYGDFEGGPTKIWHDLIESALKGTDEEFIQLRPPNGESFGEVVERAKEFLKKLDRYHGKTILIVSHGRFMRAFLSVLLNKHLREIMQEKFWNTSVTIIELKEKCEIIKYNCIEHLEVL